MQDPLPGFHDEFHPAKPGNPLYCHQEFLEKLEANKNSPVGKRASLLLQRLLVDEHRQHFKGTQGVNRGWRRSRLGGTSGSHFYAWWAPKGAPPFKDLPDFDRAPDGALFLRDIRHHDDHSPLNPQSLSAQYLELTARELREPDFVPAPWTQPQVRFAQNRARIRILKGHPGSGKTTALWNAAELAGRRSILYVTYSTDLAALARDHFDKLAPASKNFRVITFPRLLRELLGEDSAYEPVSTSRARFIQEASVIPARVLGPWQDYRGALYDEIYAHFVGEALPAPAGRFPASSEPWLAAKAYHARRGHVLGKPAADALLSATETLRKRESRHPAQVFFPELWNAWRAASQPVPEHFKIYDCIAVDEVQDLTPLEAFALIRLAAANRQITFLAAGDEAQTVRPSDFEWGWFNDMLHMHLGIPSEFKLAQNLRSPRRIAGVLNGVWSLYAHLSKQDRPTGAGRTEVDEDIGDQIMYCTASPGPDLDETLAALTRQEGLGVIMLSDTPPSYVPESLRPHLLTVTEAKGLDFQAVCVLDAGKHLNHIEGSIIRRGDDVDQLRKRLAIDQLRVALSRPTERLYWLDVKPSHEIVKSVRSFLSEDTFLPTVTPVVPAVLLKTLEEETLDVEERIRLCEADARQFLDVKPALAWSRAQQAVALASGINHNEISDNPLVRSTNLTATQVAFSLAFRKVALPQEMGASNLYRPAQLHAQRARLPHIASIIGEIETLEFGHPSTRDDSLHRLACLLAYHAERVDPWLLEEIAPRSAAWLDRIESITTEGPLGSELVPRLPALYSLFKTPDAEARLARIRRKSLQSLVRNKMYGPALDLLRKDAEPNPALMAECYEGLKDFTNAAESYLQAGNTVAALKCYRTLPDLEKALAMVDQLPGHPAAASLRWVRDMQQLAATRPADFNKVMTTPEKKLLENVLETALGVTRKKPAVKKAASKKAAVKKQARPPSRPPYF